ncbi:MAG: DNA primase [Bellilinea sp.]
MSVTDEIKARIDIVELVSETVKLRRSGKSYTGFCPFHTNTRTPAFVVFPDSGTWRCFGQCNEGGDIFRFVMKKEGWDFSETLRYLAERAGVVLQPPTPEREAEDKENERLRALLEEAVVFYRHHLQQTPAGKEAKAYLTQRGLLPETIEKFELGYAPDTWDAGFNYLTGKGYSLDELKEAGLLSESQDSGRAYDRFRHRIIFPIRDSMARMSGFGARILRPDDVPKFLNSPQTPLFDKGRLLYGLHLARKPIRTQDQAVIVEGYLDVIALHQAGFANSVSPMGTALTEDQLRMLKRFTRRMVLALDADAAGEKATLRGLEVARQALDHTDELVFDARGLLRHEARLQADVRVTTLPEGLDPDDVVLHDADAWKKIVEDAKPIVVHVMESLAAGQNLDDPKIKSEIAVQILPLIADVPSPVEREAYRQQLARLIKVDERALQVTAAPIQRGRRRQVEKQPSAAPGAVMQAGSHSLGRSMEGHCLRLLLRQPEIIYSIDRALQGAGLSRITPQDFENAEYQALAHFILEALEQDQKEPQSHLAENVPETLREIQAELLAPLPRGEPNASQILDDLMRTLVKLRLLRVDEGIRQMRFMQEELHEQGESTLTPYHELIPQYIQARGRLEAALSRPFQFE